MSISANGNGVATGNASIEAVGKAITLNWVAAIDRVDGYNVWRGSVSGGENLQVNAILIVGTSFTDPLSPSSETFYIVYSVIDGVQSQASNEVVLIAPIAMPSAWFSSLLLNTTSPWQVMRY